MTNYRYATVLEAQNDGAGANNHIEKGSRILKEGKHDDFTMEAIDGDIHYKQTQLIEAPHRMNAHEIVEYAKKQLRETDE